MLYADFGNEICILWIFFLILHSWISWIMFWKLCSSGCPVIWIICAHLLIPQVCGQRQYKNPFVSKKYKYAWPMEVCIYVIHSRRDNAFSTVCFGQRFCSYLLNTPTWVPISSLPNYNLYWNSFGNGLIRNILIHTNTEGVFLLIVSWELCILTKEASPNSH